jgi:hypothetical protein
MAKTKPHRREALESLASLAATPANNDTWTGIPAQATPAAPSVLDTIAAAKRRSRGREWEKSHHTFSYRGVPADLRDQVLALASYLNVNVDELVQVFVQYGQSCLSKGTLSIEARPREGRMTLFPTTEGWNKRAGWSEVDGWKPEQKEIPVRKKSIKTEASPLWKDRVHYRLPAEVHATIKGLAAQHFIAVGEVMTLFLKHGLESYRSGRLILNPQPKTVRMTLGGSSL